MQHLCALAREQQHVVIRNARAAHGIGTNARVRRKNTVYIGIDVKRIGVQRRCKRHSACVRAAASERCDIPCLVDPLNPRRDHDAPAPEFPFQTCKTDVLDPRARMRAVRLDGDLPGTERHSGNADGLERHRAERGAHLLPRREQHVKLARRGRGTHLLCLLQQFVRRISLRGEDDKHLIAPVNVSLDDPRHAQKMLVIAHGAAAEFLYDQAHQNHFQQKMDWQHAIAAAANPAYEIV